MLYTFVTALQALACGMILLSQILSTLQCAWTSISARRSNCLPYIVHLNPTEDFLNCLERVITPQSHRNVLVGDFNAENSDWYLSQGRDSAGECLKIFTDCQELVQLVKCPKQDTTSASHRSLLDLVFTNRPVTCVSTTVLPLLSDHRAVVIDLSLKKIPPKKPHLSAHFVYDAADIDGLTDSLNGVGLDEVLTGSVDTMTSAWSDRFLSEVRKFVPVRVTCVDPS